MNLKKKICCVRNFVLTFYVIEYVYKHKDLNIKRQGEKMYTCVCVCVS